MLNGHLEVLRRGLQVEALRRDVHMQNIANLNTPGYKRQIVRFEDQLQEVRARLPLRRTDSRHVSSRRTVAEPVVETAADTAVRPDGNSVDADRELAELTGTALRYNAYLETLSRELKTLRTVVQGR